MIRPMTVNTANQRLNDAIKRKSMRSAQNRTRHFHRRSTMICLTKVVIKSIDAIKRRDIRKINGTLSNYAQN